MWWFWLLVALASLAGLTLLLLSMPVDLTFSLEKEDRFRSRVRIGWLFGLVGKNLAGKEKRKQNEIKPDEPKHDEPKQDQEESRRRTGKGSKRFLALLGTRGLLKNSLILFKRLLRTIKVRELQADLQIGTGEPAETGQLVGVIVPVVAWVDAVTPLDINVEPDFQEEIFRAYCRGDVRAYPIRLIPPIILFAFSFSTLRGMKAVWGAR